MINDFATDEFLNKNVRVRPQSSFSQAGAENQRDARAHQALQMEEDEDKKLNDEAKYDLQILRAEAKERLRKEEMERQAELEKQEKKRRAT